MVGILMAADPTMADIRKKEILRTLNPVNGSVVSITSLQKIQTTSPRNQLAVSFGEVVLPKNQIITTDQ
jgi:hypothetical protein